MIMAGCLQYVALLFYNFCSNGVVWQKSKVDIQTKKININRKVRETTQKD